MRPRRSKQYCLQLVIYIYIYIYTHIYAINNEISKNAHTVIFLAIKKFYLILFLCLRFFSRGNKDSIAKKKLLFSSFLKC